MKKTRLSFIFIAALLAVASLFAQDPLQPTPQWRPAYHFTPLKNWTNDPNGLIYLDGVYHLYNQQNPFGIKWGHMSWGHAISKDLVHWQHLPVALPETIDKDTTWRFSGCNVLDKDNTSGLCRNGPCLVAIYTADQPNLKKESQYIAYSNDGGISYTNYENNPVIDLHKKDFRDPNVTWDEKLSKWVMVVALPREYKVRFYSSGNLKDWDLLSEFGPAGYAEAPWECPSLVQLPVEGTADEKRWVLMVSAGGGVKGTYMQYFVGDFDGKTFKNDNPSGTILAVDEGDCFYAAIPWNNLPGNKKNLLGWLVPGAVETYPWTGQMSIPRDLRLRRMKEGIRLVQTPSALIESNLDALSEHRLIGLANLEITHGDSLIDPQGKIKGNSYWLAADLTTDKQGTAGFKIGGRVDKAGNVVYDAVIGYDAAKKQLFVSRNNAGAGKVTKDNWTRTIDVENTGGRLHLQILVDRSSLEVFVNHGERVLSTHIFPDKDADLLAAFSQGGAAVIHSLKVWNLLAANETP